MKIYLVRHGETDSNREGRYRGWSEADLSPEGYAQAEKTGEFLKKLEVDALYCSDLTRAMETARVIGKKCNLEPEVKASLRELHFGEWEGLNYWEIMDGWKDAVSRWFEDPFHHPPPGGEDVNTVCRRIQDFITELKAEEPLPKAAVVVTHGGTIRAWWSYVSNASVQGFWRMEVENASVSLLVGNGDNFDLEYRNYTGHLSGVRATEKGGVESEK